MCFKPHLNLIQSHIIIMRPLRTICRDSVKQVVAKGLQVLSLQNKSSFPHSQQNWQCIYKYKQRVKNNPPHLKKSHLKRYKISLVTATTAAIQVLFQRDVDRGKRIHSPAGVLVTRGKHSLHECPYKLWESAFHNALSHGVHQGELQREMFDESKTSNVIMISREKSSLHFLSITTRHHPESVQNKCSSATIYHVNNLG